MVRLHFRSGGLGLCLVAFASIPVLAQQTAAVADSQDRAAQSLEEIVVTARKREERLQDVPIAITAFRAEDLERYGTDSITQIAAQTPQLLIGSTVGPTGLAINLRGVGSSISSPSVDQSVSINIDGIQVSQSNSLFLGLFDLGRVEILKGPQALFYGKNSPAGVISLVSADPTNEFTWYARTSYEFENRQELAAAMVSGPLSESLSARVAVSASYERGWFENLAQPINGQPVTGTDTFPNQHEYFVRGTLAYKPSDSILDATLKISADKQIGANGIFSGAQLYSCPLGRPQFSFLSPGGATDCKLDRHYIEPAFSAAAAATDPDFYRGGEMYHDNELVLSSLTANMRLNDNLTMTSVSGYYHSDDQWVGNFAGTDIENIVTGGDTDVTQYTQELRLTSNYSSPLNFMVGGFYQYADLGLRIPATFSGFLSSPPVLADNTSFDQITHAYSLFGQLLWKVTEQWEITGGARYSHESKAETGVRYPSLLSGFTTADIPFAPAEVTFHNISPEATVSFRPTSTLTFYGAYRQGFNSGGFNLVPLTFGLAAPNDNSYRQEIARGGELGLKGSLLDRQVQFDFTVYRYKYSDLQLSSLDPATLNLRVLNAGSSIVRGAESTMAYAPATLRGLTFRTGAAYNDGKYDSYPNAGCWTGQTQAQGCDGNMVAGVGTSQNLSGRPLQLAPRWAINLGSTWNRPLPNNLVLGPSIDAVYSGNYFSQPEESPESLQSSAWRLNAGLTLSGNDGGWELSLIGRNLTNVLRAVSTFSAPFTGSGTGTNGPTLKADLVGSVSDPRTVLLQFKIKDPLFSH